MTGAGGVTVFANSSIAAAKPTISSTVSPFVRSAIRKPPACAGVASPSMSARTASAASSDDSDSFAVSRERREGQKSASCRSMGKEP